MKRDPVYEQRMAQLATGYGPIALRRIGDFAVVEVEYLPGKWIEVIRECIDGNFLHIVEPRGIMEVMRRNAGYDPETGRMVK